MAYDFKKEEDVKQFLENIGIEYRFGCFSEKNPASCHLLGEYLDAVKKDYEKAAKVYRNNCDDFSHPRSCYKYANYKFLGRGVKKDCKDSFQYYQKGCTAGEGAACLHGGLMCVSNSKSKEGVPQDYKLGLELLAKGCDKDNAMSCHYLAGMFIVGVKEKLEKDMKKAFEYSMRACNLGNMQACANVSQMYRKGDGVAEDLTKSEEYKKKVLDTEAQYKDARTLTFQQGT